MRRSIRTVAMFGCAAALAAGPIRADGPHFDLGATATARSHLLGCDSAVVMLQVRTDHREIPMRDGSVRSSGSYEILARGENGADWVRRFTDALLPPGRGWTARVAPQPEVDREDDRLPWTVHVTTYAHGKVQGFWCVNLLDGWAGEGLGTPHVVFDLLGPADSLRAVLAAGMQADFNGARRLRQIREPDAAIMPLPEHRKH